MANVNKKEVERVHRNVQLAAHTMRFREYQGDEATKKYYKEGIQVLQNIQRNLSDLENSNRQYVAKKVPEEYSRLIKASIEKFDEKNAKIRNNQIAPQKEDKRADGYVETKEEQIKQYAKTFKQKIRDLKKVKNRVDEYVKSGRKVIDDFLEHEKDEIEKIHDKRNAFKELVELTYANKL